MSNLQQVERRSILHKIAHFLCVNKAVKVIYTIEKYGDYKFIGFKCLKCGQID